MLECEECLYNGMNFQDIGSGEDENGKFTDYECPECYHATRVYETD